MNVFSKLLCRILPMPWTQPKLTSNGTFGGNNMAVDVTYHDTTSQSNSNGSKYYVAFMPNSGYVGQYTDEESGHNGYLRIWIYYPKPIRLNHIRFFVNNRETGQTGPARNVKLYGGNSRSSINVEKGSTTNMVLKIGNVDIGKTYQSDIAMNEYYQYYMLHVENLKAPFDDRVEIKSIKLDGDYEEFI